MKILLASTLFEPHAVGGAEKVVKALATALTRHGHEVVVITTQPRGAAMHRLVGDVSVHYIPVRNLYRPFSGSEPGAVRKTLWRMIDSYNPFMKRALAQIIAREKPDVVNTHNLNGLSVSMWTAVSEQGIPIVHTMHDQYLLCHRSTMFKNGENCARQCADCRLLAAPRKYASKHVNVAIGVSKFILDRHKGFGYFESAESTVIYNTGLGERPQSSNRPERRGTMRLGFLGQIIPTKGLHELIDAFRRVGSVNAELWIGGNGESIYASELRRKTQADSSIQWLGFVNPGDFFRDIDALVVPSLWHDTAPLVILEAFNHGVPVLGSSRGGIPELIGTDTGWLFDPGKPDALRLALIGCIQSANLGVMGPACLRQAQLLGSSPWADAYLRAYGIALARSESRKKLAAGSA